MSQQQTLTLTQKALRFGLVGLANTGVDLAIFAALVALAVPALGANIGAWLVAVCFSYLVNSRWSFERDTSLHEGWAFLRFISLGALISLGISSLAVILLPPRIGLWPAKILGVVVAAILNFFAAHWSIENRLR
ncbi:GtrA family protein [Aerobium aerolatum]|uniref:Flippase GtrA (Transmembrane translocase of bactoprenol-linked glucose) n=1 Tax=Aquamicrobium aerolatum DSM 21857 TaxID=1121003 RepID=A0A1I3L174_9HYPH|nr:GtrA family protein [Aquamicrobium aerolatum]SFI78378.1 Putative flippase GtrA (transmembrane translocase of bactoprenol-linked glucose) [Aquamicrobium aerolatum DSM 21857]